MNDAGWRADPTGRHELRWFDGTRFTDQVADGGAQSTDLGAEPQWPAAPPTSWAAPDQPAEPAALPRFDVGPARRKRRWLPAALALGALVVLSGAGAYWWFEIKGPPTGAGTFEGAVDEDAPLGVHRVFVPAGSIALVTVTPTDDFDAVVGFVPDEDDDAAAVEDLLDGTGFELVAREAALPETDVDEDELEALGVLGERVVMLVDSGFEGQPERTLLVLGTDVPAAVVVAGFTDVEGISEGSYEIVVELVDLELGPEELEELRGQQALDVAARSEAVPDVFRSLIDETE